LFGVCKKDSTALAACVDAARYAPMGYHHRIGPETHRGSPSAMESGLSGAERGRRAAIGVFQCFRAGTGAGAVDAAMGVRLPAKPEQEVNAGMTMQS